MRLLFSGVLCFTLITTSVPATRHARALAFRKGSSYFYRLNYKITSFPYSPIFAQAAGFKVVWQLPPSSGGRNGRSISDIHESVKLVYESHGFDGKSCLLKNICQALKYIERTEGVMAKIVKLLVGSYINNATSSQDMIYCDDHSNNCPLQLISFHSFTEG